MREELEHFNQIHHMFGRGDHIIVAVSGGADSVCLLELLYELRDKWELSLHVLHVHHGIRGEEADKDARYVEKLAEERQLPYCCVQVNVPEEAEKCGMSEEEMGRVLRYEILEKYRKEVGGDCIAVAHHQGDQAETVLFHLFRGSGPRGLSGIPAKRGRIIRPLLFAQRREIETYLRQRQLAWCQDATNQEVNYTRNRIRHEILALAEEHINPRAGEHIAQAAEKITAWRSYIEKKGEQAFDYMVTRENGQIILKTDPFAKEDPVIQAEILRQVFEAVIPGAKNVGQIHYRQVMDLLGNSAGKKQDLPMGVCVERQYSKISFYRQKSEKQAVCVVCEVPSRHIVKGGGALWQFTLELKKRVDLPKEIPQKDYTKWFDYGMIKTSLMIRSPQEGDYFVMDKTRRKKRLSRYYIDRKIPHSERMAQLVVADGNHVLWAVPDRISETYKITDNTEWVLVITKERIPS